MSRLKTLIGAMLLTAAVAGQELAQAGPEPAYHVDLDTAAASAVIPGPVTFGNGSALGVALFDEGADAGVDGILTSISLPPGDQQITVSSANAAATETPEPDVVLLMAVGLAAMGLVARRRQESARFG